MRAVFADDNAISIGLDFVQPVRARGAFRPSTFNGFSGSPASASCICRMLDPSKNLVIFADF